jgi:Domain of unknown function (DUF222)
MSELMSALDALAAEDVRSLSPRQKLDGISEMLAAKNRLDAQVARWVRSAELDQAPEDDGKKTMKSWLRGHGRVSPAVAGQVVRTGRALEKLPALAAAFAAGAVTAEQVAVIAPVVQPKRVAAALAKGIDLAELDSILTAVAVEHQIEQVSRAVHHYLSRLDPDGPEPDPTGERALTISHALRRHGPPARSAGRGRWGEVQGGDRVGRAGRPAQGRSADPRPAAGRRPRAAGRQPTRIR